MYENLWSQYCQCVTFTRSLSIFSIFLKNNSMVAHYNWNCNCSFSTGGNCKCVFDSDMYFYDMDFYWFTIHILCMPTNFIPRQLEICFLPGVFLLFCSLLFTLNLLFPFYFNLVYNCLEVHGLSENPCFRHWYHIPVPKIKTFFRTGEHHFWAAC